MRFFAESLQVHHTNSRLHHLQTWLINGRSPGAQRCRQTCAPDATNHGKHIQYVHMRSHALPATPSSKQYVFLTISISYFIIPVLSHHYIETNHHPNFQKKTFFWYFCRWCACLVDFFVQLELELIVTAIWIRPIFVIVIPSRVIKQRKGTPQIPELYNYKCYVYNYIIINLYIGIQIGKSSIYTWELFQQTIFDYQRVI